MKCDTTTHLPQPATVTCSHAQPGPLPTCPSGGPSPPVSGMPSCVARATCFTIDCAAGWTIDPSTSEFRCAGATCDSTGPDNDLCCMPITCAAVGEFPAHVVTDSAGGDGCAVSTVLVTDAGCTTTPVPECAAANADRETCEAAGSCTFTAVGSTAAAVPAAARCAVTDQSDACNVAADRSSCEAAGASSGDCTWSADTSCDVKCDPTTHASQATTVTCDASS